MSFIRGIADREDSLAFIDGLRGVAVLMVMFHHALNAIPNAFHFRQVHSLFDHGFNGVSLFFILSAFCLMRSSHRRFQFERRPRLNFYLRRAFRILPFWWLMVALFTDGFQASPVVLWMNVWLFFGFSSNLSYRVVPGSWSLFCEETFYVLFPLLFPLIKDSKKNTWFCFFMTYLGAFIFIKYAYDPASGPMTELVWGSPLGNYFWFFIGILIFHYDLEFRNNQGVCFADEFARQNPLLSFSVLVLGMICLPILNFSASAIVLVLLFIVGRNEGNPVHWFLNLRWLRLFGICCYSIYFLHFAVMDRMHFYSSRMFSSGSFAGYSGEIQFIAYVLVEAVLCLAVGLVSFFLIEKPAVWLGSRVIHRLESANIPLGNA